MERARDLFLSGPRFALQQQPDPLRRDPSEGGEELTHRRRLADELAERFIRAQERRLGSAVEIEAESRLAEEELRAGGELDLRDPVRPEPCSVRASGVPHVNALALTARLKMNG